MPRQAVVGTQQVFLHTRVDKKYMEAGRQVKRITGKLMSDQVREALSMYYTDMVKEGLVDVSLSRGPIPFDDWSGLVKGVRDALSNYRSRASESVVLHYEGKPSPEDATAELAAALKAALETFEERKAFMLGKAKSSVGEGAKDAA